MSWKKTKKICSLWDGCSSNCCPLENPYLTHFAGEDVCPYLMEAAKEDRAVYPVREGSDTEAIISASEKAWANRSALSPALRKVLDRSSGKGSRRSNPNLYKRQEDKGLESPPNMA